MSRCRSDIADEMQESDVNGIQTVRVDGGITEMIDKRNEMIHWSLPSQRCGDYAYRLDWSTSKSARLGKGDD